MVERNQERINRSNFMEMVGSLGVDLYDSLDKQYKRDIEAVVAQVNKAHRRSQLEYMLSAVVDCRWQIMVVAILLLIFSAAVIIGNNVLHKNAVDFTKQLQTCKSGDLLGCQIAIKDAKDSGITNHLDALITAYVITKGAPPPPMVGEDPYNSGLQSCKNGDLLSCQIAIKERATARDVEAVKVFTTAYVIAKGGPPPPLVGDATPNPFSMNGLTVKSTDDKKGVLVVDGSGKVVSSYDPK